MNKLDRLFRAEQDLFAANREIASLRQEKAVQGKQILELREIVAKLTKANA